MPVPLEWDSLSLKQKENIMFRLFLLAVTLAGFASAQSTWAGMAGLQKQVAGNLRKSAEKMPAESYGFKPSHDVMAFQDFLTHLADVHNMICSGVLGEANPEPGIGKTKKTKEEISGALDRALTYCDKAYASITDATANQPMKLFGQDRTKAAALQLNTAHAFEHYGNLVTYLRIRGFVPPSSEPRRP